MAYIITSWTGRVLFNGKEFETFEGAWDYIYQADPEPEQTDPRWLDGWFEDYYVDLVETVETA